MTKRQPPRPDGLNVKGTGLGLKKVTRPITKRRGASATPEARTASAVAKRVYMDTSTNAAAALVDPNKPLTEKQKLFVKYWAQGESITSASHRAGYGDGASLAYRMVRMPNVLRLYEEEKRLYAEASQMTRKKVMDGLLEAIEMAKLMAEPASMISGWREVGKMCGFYEPVQKKLDITVNGNVVFQRLERLSDAELMKLIQAPVEEAVAQELLGDDGED